ncbi:YqgE/AlgH family protein [Limibacter armeniacum]|uniref:YqgE/AlgH family protein n=1 Tax=Limibacter armeniacum TaxID=466084 RepID=UPI002FE50AC1
MDFDLNFSQNVAVKKGDLLVAEPFLKDPNFERSVILICEHTDEEGSFGLILNKQSLVSVEQVTDQLQLNSPLYVGGPVEQNTLYYIHKFKDLDGALPLKNGLYWGGSYDHLKELSTTGQVSTENCRFFMGYSGWGSFQLKGELERNSWIVTHANLSGLFDIDPDKLWKKVLTAMGGKYKVIANYPMEPRMN